MSVDTSVAAAVTRLESAARTGIPCDPVRDLLGTEDTDCAYAVQRALTERRLTAGARVVGHKIGLTSAAVQQQLGVDQPDFGILLDDMDVSGRPEILSARLLQPKIEAEIAFRLGRDLSEGTLDLPQIRDAVEGAAAALEIVDSRIADWDITITDTIADNGSSGLFVLSDSWFTLDEVEPKDVTMTMSVDGVVASEGNGAACLGDPLEALAWLARVARHHGRPLRAGQIILSGALGPMVPALPGTTVHAEISVLGPVSATFSTKDRRQ